MMLMWPSFLLYNCYRKDRDKVKRSNQNCGVILYVKNDLVSYEHEELNEVKAETIWCKIKSFTNIEIVMEVCYKSQAADTNEIQKIFKAISKAS